MNTFEFIADNGTARQCDAAETERLLEGYSRDPAQARLRLANNPFAVLLCEGGRIRYNPELDRA